MRIYFDSAPVIDLVEQVPPFGLKVLARITQLGVVLVSSALTRTETSIVPLRRNDSDLLLDYDNFFSTQIAEWAPFSDTVFVSAAKIRAQHNYKTPDALHLAAAIEASCDVFLTNDLRLKAFPGITVEVVS